MNNKIKTKMYGYEIHKFAKLLPMMGNEDFDRLRESVEEHGVQVPIIMFEGMVLDGRNRLKAAEQCGIKKADIPIKDITKTGMDAVTHVGILNLERRHLDQSQRAMVAAGLHTVSGPRQKDASKQLHVSRRTTVHAATVIKKGSSRLIDAVKEGKIAVSKAAKITAFPKTQQNAIVKSGGVIKPAQGWQVKKAKLIATANAAMRLLDDLQDAKPAKNNLNISMMRNIQAFIEEGGKWK